MIHISPSGHGAPSPRLTLKLADLVEIERESRIPDLILAVRLGYEKPHNVRKLIDRNRDELAAHGLVVARPSTFLHGGEKSGGRTGRPGTAFLLNEGQALVVCALSRTPIAARVRQDIIAVYMAHRHSAGWQAPRLTSERVALREICERGHAYPVAEPIRLDSVTARVARHVLVVPASDELLDALGAFAAEEADLEPETVEDDCELCASDDVDGEPTLGWTDDGQTGWITAGEDEPSLGWQNRGSQERLTRSDNDRETDLGWQDEGAQTSLGVSAEYRESDESDVDADPVGSRRT